MEHERNRIVVGIDQMDDETLARHFLARHGDHLPNMVEFTHTALRDPNLMASYRAFHELIHRMDERVSRINHDHVS